MRPRGQADAGSPGWDSPDLYGSPGSLWLISHSFAIQKPMCEGSCKRTDKRDDARYDVHGRVNTSER